MTYHLLANGLFVDDAVDNDPSAPYGTDDVASSGPSSQSSTASLGDLPYGGEPGQTPTVAPNIAEVSFLTGVGSNGVLTAQSYWGATGAHKWINNSPSSTSGPAGVGGGTVTYYFDPASNWTASEQASLAGGLSLWSAVANIQFAQTGTAAGADVTFTRNSLNEANTTNPSYAGSGSNLGADTGGAVITIDDRGGFGYIDSFSSGGGYGYDTVVHEEGHLLGLGHGGDYNFQVNPATQQNGPFDSRLWTLMSYIQPDTTSAEYYGSYPVTGTSWGTTSDGYSRAPYTWMPLDILAAQQIYGVATVTPLSGGQVFGFDTNIAASSGIRPYFDFTVDTTPVITLYDTGGGNTLDLSGYATNSTVDMRDGHFSSVAGLTNNIAIAYGTHIDTAIGGSGNDVFQVNADNDAINGGGGNNTVTFLGNFADYVISKAANLSVTIRDSNTARGGIDTLTNIQTLQFADRSVQTLTLPVADPLFNVAYYLTNNPDVAKAGVDPYQHYEQYGGFEGRDPDAYFDSNYYLAQNPDVKASGENPLQHFETFGYLEGRAPSLLFSDASYLDAYPDVKAAGVDPLVHYLQFGQAEGRMAFLSGGADPADPLVNPTYYDPQLGATLLPTGTPAQQQAAYSYDTVGWHELLNPDTLFNTSYYLSHNPDVAAAGVDPLLHYETFGWKEGRDPSAAFDTNKYLAAYPDVRNAGIDPLLHYIQNGQAEGRQTFSV